MECIWRFRWTSPIRRVRVTHHRGTIGKALPFALVVGHSSHASYRFEGISAQLIASKISKALEANPALRDQAVP